MERPIKCFTCGKVLGDKYAYFIKKANQGIKGMKGAKGSNNNIQQITYLTTENTQPTLIAEILNEMGLTRICCRTIMQTSVVIDV